MEVRLPLGVPAKMVKLIHPGFGETAMQQTIESLDKATKITGIELSVIVPTFNEAENISPLLDLLQRTLGGTSYEVIFVDDNSPDGTATLVKSIARVAPRVRCIHRIKRRGLASAVAEGIMSSAAPYVAVMDADLQHDETLLPKMLQIICEDQAEVVVASRYMAGGSLGNWTAGRAWMSRFATKLADLVLDRELSDPMSGFFMTKREFFDEASPKLSSEGYKILLDFLASSPRKLRCVELPYSFRNRLHGKSKLDSAVLWEYALLILDKLLGGMIPPRFLLFSAVGGTGVLVHLAVLGLLYDVIETPFEYAQGGATVVAMTTNFCLNNMLTYRDRRLKGCRVLRGLLTFYLVCSLGAFANVGVASYIFGEQAAGWFVAGLAGVLIGTVFNFAMTSIFTWQQN